MKLSESAIQRLADIRSRAAPQQSGSDYLSNFDPKTVLSNPQFLQDVRDVMSSQGQEFASDDEMLQEFFWERNWRDLNFGAAVGGDAGYNAVNRATDDIKSKMGRIQRVFDQYPAFWQEGGRGIIEGLEDSVPALLLAPENLLPGGAAVKAGRGAYVAGKSALGAGIKEGGKYGLIASAPVEFGQNIANQLTDLESEAQTEFSGTELATATALGGVFGAGVGGVIGGVAGAVGGKLAKGALQKIGQLQDSKAQMLDADPNADTSAIDAEIQALQQKNEIPAAQEAIEEEDFVDTTPDPIEPDEDPTIDLMAEADAEKSIAQNLYNENNLGGIDKRLDKSALKDPEVKESFKQAKVAMNKAGIYRQVARTQKAIEEIDRKLETETNQKKQYALEQEKIDLEVNYGAVLEYVKRGQAEELEDAVNTMAENQYRRDENQLMLDLDDPDAPKKETAAETDPEPTAPEPEPEPVDALEARYAEMANVNNAVDTIESLNLEPEQLASLEDNPEIMREMLTGLNQGVEGYTVPDLSKVFAKLRGTDEPEVLEAPTGVTAQSFKTRLAKSVTSKMDLDALSQGTRQSFMTDLEKFVDRLSIQKEKTPSFKMMDSLRELAELEYQRLIEMDEGRREGGQSFLGRDDTFFNNEEGRRQAGLGKAERKATRKDITEAAGLKARAEQNKAENEALKGKDADDTSKYKDTTISAIMSTGRKLPNGNQRYRKGDRVTYNADTKKFTIEKMSKRRGSKVATPTEALASIDDSKEFAEALVQLVSDGKLDPSAIGEIQAQRRARLAGAKEEVAPTAATEEVAPAVSTDTPVETTTASSTMPQIPDGRVHAIRRKNPKSKVHKYEHRMLGKNQTSYDQLYGKSDPSGWERGHVSIDDNPFRGKVNFVPLGEEAVEDTVTAAIENPPLPAKDIPTIEKLRQDPLNDVNYIEVAGLEGSPFEENLVDFDKRIKKIEDLYSVLPEYKASEQTRLEAWGALDKIFSAGKLEGTSVSDLQLDKQMAKDVLRRLSNANKGMAPQISRGDQGAYVGKTGGIQLSPSINGRDQYHTVIHEMFHWAYMNVLTPQDRGNMLKEMRSYYAPDGSLDYQKIQEMSPYLIQFPTEANNAQKAAMVATGKLDPMEAKYPTRRTERDQVVMSRFSPQEFLAGQFQMYVEGRLPYKGTLLSKMGYLLERIVEHMFGMKKKSPVDKNLIPYFDKLYSDNAQDFISRTSDPTTPEGKSIETIMDGFNNQRIDLEDAFDNVSDVDGRTVYGPSSRQIRQSYNSLDALIEPDETGVSVASDLVRETELGRALNDSPTVRQELAKVLDDINILLRKDANPSGSPISSPLDRLDAGNRVIDAFDMIDEALFQRYKSVEGSNPRPVAIPVRPIKQATSGEGKRNQKLLEDVREAQVKFQQEFSESGSSREELKSILQMVTEFTSGLSYHGGNPLAGSVRRIGNRTSNPKNRNLVVGEKAERLSLPTRATAAQIAENPDNAYFGYDKRFLLPGTIQKISRDMRAMMGLEGKGTTKEDVAMYADMDEQTWVTTAVNSFDDMMDQMYLADTRLQFKIIHEDRLQVKRDKATAKANRQKVVEKKRVEVAKESKKVADKKPVDTKPTPTKKTRKKTRTNKRTKTAPARSLDEEIRTKPETQRSRDIGAEWIRRVRAASDIEPVAIDMDTVRMPDAELESSLIKALNDGNKKDVQKYSYEMFLRNNPDAKPILKFESPKLVGLLELEDLHTRGVSRVEGVPNDAPEYIRSVLTKVTHRDPDTQRVARNLAHRLLLLSDSPAKADEKFDINGDGFNDFRNELRSLSKALVGSGKTQTMSGAETVDMAMRLAIQANPLTDLDAKIIKKQFDLDQFQAVRVEVERDMLGDNTQDMANEWFMRMLSKAISGERGEAPFTGSGFEHLNNLVKERIKDTSYLVNGLMSRGDVRKAGRRLTLYGDLFKNVTPKDNELRMVNQKQFIGSGLGADAEGNPITYYHSSPNTKVFDEKDFIFDGSSGFTKYGKGIYLSRRPEVSSEMFADMPTPMAMDRMMRNATSSPEELGLGMHVVEDYLEVRSNLREIDNDLRNNVDLPFDVDGVVYNLIEKSEDLTRQLKDFGVEMSPGTVPVIVRAENPLDITEATKITKASYDSGIGQVVEQLDSAGLIDMEYLDSKLAGMGRPMFAKTFMAQDVYINVLDAMVQQRMKTPDTTDRPIDVIGLEDQITTRDLFNEVAEFIGFDSLRTTEYNSNLEQGGRTDSYEGAVIFNSSSVKHPDAEYFDSDSPFFWESPQTSAQSPQGKLFQTLVTDEDATAANTGQFYTDAEGLGAHPSVVDAMKKIGAKKELATEDYQALSKYNPIRFLSDNAKKLRYNNMHWLGNWAKPEDGVSIHDTENADMAKKVMPLFTEMKKLSGEGKVMRWGRGLKFYGQASQPKEYKNIVRALRRQSQNNLQNLTAAEKKVAVAIRSRFDLELQDMKDAGIRVGTIPDNYFPQVWNVEAIRENYSKFTKALTAYLHKEQTTRLKPSEYREVRDLQDIADHMANTLIAEDGVYLPHQSSKYARAGGKTDAEYMRLIRLNEADGKGKLVYEDVLNFMEKEGFLADDLQSVISKYFEGTTRRIAYQKKFGTNNHGFYDYIQVRANGAKEAVKLLSTDKVVTSTRKRYPEFGQGIENHTVRIPELRGMREDQADMAVQIAMQNIENGAGVQQTMNYLNALKPNSGRGYRRRVEAIANGLVEHQKFGNLEKKSATDTDPVVFAENYFSILQGRPVNNDAYFQTRRRVSKGARAFNSVTLLGFTTLTSFTDVSLPFIRGARFRDATKALYNSTVGPDAKHYRAALASVGASMDNITHSRMTMLYGGTGGKISNAFFNANLLTPWTNGMKEAAVAIGYEMLKANARIAQEARQSGVIGQSRKFRQAKRKLSQFGLGDYADNDRSLEDVALLYDDPRLRAALHKFSGESIFSPSKTDVPLIFQDPMSPEGAMLFQLKSYPLMYQRLAYRTFNEAKRWVVNGDGDIGPLINMATIGTGSGALALLAKDIVQMRGGDDERSSAPRERSYNKIMEELGYDARIHGDDKDAFAGWAIESIMHMGGLGLVADVFYQAAMQGEKGSYGTNRIMGLIAGPTYGSVYDAVGVVQGVDSDGISRAATRSLAQRIPFITRDWRESIIDTVARDPKNKKKKGMKSGLSSGLK